MPARVFSRLADALSKPEAVRRLELLTLRRGTGLPDFAYGIGSGMDYRVAPGPFLISSAIVTPQTGAGLSTIIPSKL